MQKLEVTQPDAIKAYSSADAKGKKLLSDLFGEKVFNQKITDRVKTFEDACEILGIKPSNIYEQPFPSMMENDSMSISAYYKLILIARALNEGWTPDWNDTDQYKYYPWFRMKAGFSNTYYVAWSANAAVGSRLCFKTAELAEYAGKQFEAIYNEFLSL